MNKFLDEDNIIKQTQIHEKDINIEFEEETYDEIIQNEEQINSIKPISSPSLHNNEEKPVEKEKQEILKNTITIKTDKEIQIELMNKYKLQLLSKTVDLDYAHKSYKDAMNTNERNMAEMTYENLSKDIKIIKQKINILGDIIGRNST